MIKTCLKGSIKLIILCASILLCLFFSSEILRPIDLESKDNTQEKVDGFYALDKNSLNVLVLGTSHSYYAFNPAILWHETGLTSYVFAGQCQPIEVTYYYLLEALKTQSPEVVILDIFALGNQSTMCQTEGTYRVNIQDLNFGENKYNAYKLLDNQNAIENLFDVSLYHERVTDLDFNSLENPLTRKFNPSFGYSLNYPKNQITWDRNELEISERVKPDSRRMEYLYKIMDVLEKKGIPLILIKTPYYIDDEDAKIYNSIWDVAEERNIPVIDFNQKLKELNFIFDIDGDSWHTNARGAMKVTSYIANELLEKYSFSENYEQYNTQYQVEYAKTLYALYSRQFNFEILRDYFDSTGVTVLINYNKKGPIELNNEDLSNYQSLGIDFSLANQLISYRNHEFVIEDDEINLEVNNHHYKLDSNGDLWIDNQWINSQDTSLKFIVIDNETGYLVDNFQIDFLDQLYIYRK
ncbi:MAG: hypothetical protein RR925_06250 [Erysipelotrichaceae bacterium]